MKQQVATVKPKKGNSDLDSLLEPVSEEQLGQATDSGEISTNAEWIERLIRAGEGTVSVKLPKQEEGAALRTESGYPNNLKPPVSRTA